MRYLHITNWYPSALEPREAPFIKRHVEALRTQGEHDVWHVQVITGKGWRLIRTPGNADRTFQLVTPIRRWLLIEWLTFLLIAYAWITRPRGRGYGLVNFYIAYPAGVRIAWLRRLIRLPMTFSEQWSAYHFGFHGASSGVERTRRIFRHGIPVICVSKALAEDIRTFAGVPELETHVIDNVVDVAHFGTAPDEAFTEGRFFAVSLWRKPKRPEVMLEALALLVQRGRNPHLRLGGDGPETDNIRATIARLGLEAHVTLLGRMAPAEIGVEMRLAHAVWHCSDYETFSVVCAEGTCCGTPVIASRVGGIPGFVDETNGTLVATNTAADWAQAVERMWSPTLTMDRAANAARMRERFAATTVGARFQGILEEVEKHRS